MDRDAKAAMAASSENVRPLPWFAIPTVVAAFHLLACLVLTFDKSSADGSWHWFPMFIVDLPISLFFPPLQRSLPDAVLFGAFGTLWWFLITSSVAVAINLSRRERAKRATRES